MRQTGKGDIRSLLRLFTLTIINKCASFFRLLIGNPGQFTRMSTNSGVSTDTCASLQGEKLQNPWTTTRTSVLLEFFNESIQFPHQPLKNSLP